MNKKQVMKVTYTDTGRSIYGIALDSDRVLLENSNVAYLSDNKTHTLQRYANKTFAVMQSAWDKSVEITATRNVPTEVRTLLEQGMSDFLEAEKLNEQLKLIQQQLSDKLEFVQQVMPVDVTTARGILLPEEFIEVFQSNLSASVKNELNNLEQICVGYFNDPCPYRFEIYGGNDNKTLLIEREVFIEKYYRCENEMCCEEYDGTMSMRHEAKHTNLYQRYIKEYSEPLPVKGVDFHERLGFGDKSTLMYMCSYTIPLTKDLTEEYAKQLAKDFCDPKKRLDKEKPNKGAER